MKMLRPSPPWFLIATALCAALISGTVAAQPANLLDTNFASAQFISQSVNRSMEAGTTQRITIHVKNVGTTSWTRDQGVVLAIQPPGAKLSWGVEKVELAPEETVAPGEEKQFQFDITAPERPDAYPFVWRLLKNGDLIAGSAATAVTIRVDDPLLRANFVSQIVPERVSPGETFRVIVQFQNAGQSSWSADHGHILAALTSNAKTVWGVDTVALKGSTHVLPGETTTFAFAARAPSEKGRYPMQWQMFHKDRAWFGEATPATMITVGEAEVKLSNDGLNAEFISQVVPEVMYAGEMYSVTVVFRNTGSLAWQSPQVTLVATNPPHNLNWFVDTVDLETQRPVKGGTVHAFRFNVRAPEEPGRYNFQWRMNNRFGDMFGEPSENVEVIVKP